jgi:hypothetical protein
MASRRTRSTGQSVSLRETLVSAGLEPRLADLLAAMPHRIVQVEPRRPFREPGGPRNEVMFVRSGILAKFKPAFRVKESCREMVMLFTESRLSCAAKS